MDEPRVWILDVEGNGRNPGEIVELSAVEMIGWSLTGVGRTWRFRPRESVEWYATRVHGISNADLADCPRIEERADEILGLIGDDPIAGHSVDVELDFLGRALPRWRPAKAYDTLRMAKATVRDAPRYKLTAIGDHLGLTDAAKAATGREAHSAHFDAVLCGLLLGRLVKMTDHARLDHLLAQCDLVELRTQSERRRHEREARREAQRRWRESQGLPVSRREG